MVDVRSFAYEATERSRRSVFFGLVLMMRRVRNVVPWAACEGEVPTREELQGRSRRSGESELFELRVRQ